MQTKTKSEQSKRKSCVTWTVLYFACRWLYWFHLWCVCHLCGIHVVSFHAERRPRSGSFLQRWQKTSRHIQRPLALNEQNVWAGFSEDLRELSRRAASKADAGSPRARSVTAPTLASSRSTKSHHSSDTTADGLLGPVMHRLADYSVCCSVKVRITRRSTIWCYHKTSYCDFYNILRYAQYGNYIYRDSKLNFVNICFSQ